VEEKTFFLNNRLYQFHQAMAVSKKLPPFDSKCVDPDTLEEASFAMGKSMKHKTPITPKTPKKVPETYLHFFKAFQEKLKYCCYFFQKHTFFYHIQF
jgi:hypothetical protein